MIPKNCPHCAGVSRLCANYSPRLHTYFVFVKCDICGAQGKAYPSRTNPAEEDWESYTCRDAVAAWDMRAGTTEDESEKPN